ncbi:hypothetical protein BFJ63_vAg18792 [Fusarium oxysporum f. sp. narcissi]|uniref:Uncharacterized protein n=1 Tax=Fusarium oxysporum f. sp. narcissi TaxID=451672 RepID=A0A4Q2V1Z4_FUSOX|nr:hypothetical protein BFJ63_vAg18792 [Fusarium oxysporum f. sp. narcissi]
MCQASVLRGTAVTVLSHDDENVSRTLSIVGGIYACRNPRALQISARQRQSILSAWKKQKSISAVELRRPNTSRFSSVLLCALLLAVAELLLDASGHGWQLWLQRISDFLISYSDRKDGSSYTIFEQGLIQFFQFNNLLGAISRGELPLGPQCLISSPCILPRPAIPSLAAQQPCDQQQIDRVLCVMWQWTELQQRMQHWISHAEKQPRPSNKHSTQASYDIDRIVRGLEIVCSASTLQAQIVEELLNLSRFPQDQITVCLNPYYHWALTGLSQALQHNAWQFLSCELPVMSAEALHQQATLALDCLEQIASESELDVAFYLSVVDFVGLEMASMTQRKRMLTFLDVVKARGFDITEEYKADLLKSWR